MSDARGSPYFQRRSLGQGEDRVHCSRGSVLEWEHGAYNGLLSWRSWDTRIQIWSYRKYPSKVVPHWHHASSLYSLSFIHHHQTRGTKMITVELLSRGQVDPIMHPHQTITAVFITDVRQRCPGLFISSLRQHLPQRMRIGKSLVDLNISMVRCTHWSAGRFKVAVSDDRCVLYWFHLIARDDVFGLCSPWLGSCTFHISSGIFKAMHRLILPSDPEMSHRAARPRLSINMIRTVREPAGLIDLHFVEICREVRVIQVTQTVMDIPGGLGSVLLGGLISAM
ncbi:hypothetical protein EDC04DRAFT_3093016, partial [Pisolithus marmoratus]